MFYVLCVCEWLILFINESNLIPLLNVLPTCRRKGSEESRAPEADLLLRDKTSKHCQRTAIHPIRESLGKNATVVCHCGSCPAPLSWKCVQYLPQVPPAFMWVHLLSVWPRVTWRTAAHHPLWSVFARGPAFVYRAELLGSNPGVWFRGKSAVYWLVWLHYNIVSLWYVSSDFEIENYDPI